MVNGGRVVVAFAAELFMPTLIFSGYRHTAWTVFFEVYLLSVGISGS